MFVALFSFGVAPAALGTSQRRLEEALNPFDQADLCGTWRDERALVVQTLTWNTPESKLEEVPYHCPETGRVVAAWVRLDNREDLMRKLGVDNGRGARTTDPMLVLAAFNRWGPACTEHLLGDFSFVIYDAAKRTMFAARDPLGVKPLYYHSRSDLVVLATTPAAFHAVDGVTLTPSESWIARHVLGVSHSHTQTAWPEVTKLPGGHQIMFEAGRSSIASSEPRRYFEFRDDSPDARTRSGEWVDQYRAVLEESVRSRLRTDYPLGCETSGGIDSSTCLGLAAVLSDRGVDELHTFGFVHFEQEPDLILETSRLHGLVNDHIHALGRPDTGTERVERTLRVLGYPEEHGNGSGHEPFYRECEQYGVRTLLSGFGGDEVVTNSGHLLRRELIDRRRFAMLVADMHGPVVLRPLRLVRTLQRDRKGSKMPSHLRGPLSERWRHFSVRPEIVERYSLREHYDGRSAYDEGYRSINAFAMRDRMAAAFVPTRLENCTLMAQARRVDYRWPLWDVRLVQQYLSTPSIEKKRRGMGRYLHRRAIGGVVPEKVRWKATKDMGEPLQRRPPGHAVDAVRALRRDLHPTVDAIVDTEKLMSEAAASDAAPADSHQALPFAVRRQLVSVTALNAWLLHYHP